MSWVGPSNSALLTDLYELTMAASYHSQGKTGPATFDLFVRELPRTRNFLIACGLQQALEYLEGLHFEEDAVAYLSSLELFADDFLDYLARLRFTGDVWAVPEGEAVFAGEPILRVTAPLIEAQVVETFLINCVGFQTMVASKAARVALACGDKMFVDFSLRRDHAADAGLKAARASFVAGASATSNLLAGSLYGIPVNGTMAHSYVMVFDSEEDAFRAFARDFPNRATLLIDTFDVEEGARRAAKVATELAAEGNRVQGVRIDSGDLGALAHAVRAILDGAGLRDVKIFLSGDLDEYRVAELVTAGAPADGFGVGTRMGTSADAPYLGAVYKLVADERGPRIKLSSHKVTVPGVKQIFRRETSGRYDHDLVALADEEVEGRPVLVEAMASGRPTGEAPGLERLQERCRATLGKLPERLRVLGAADPYEVRISDRLRDIRARLGARPDRP